MTTENQAPTQEELLDATTPEKLAALMAKSGEGEEGVSNEEQPPAAPAPAPASEGAAPSTTVEEQPTGIATKSGKGVLPYHVLLEARDKATKANERADQALRERDEALQRINQVQGKVVPDELLSVAQDMTDGELDDLKFTNPKAHKAVMLARSLTAPPAPAPAAAPAPAPTQEPTPEQQEALDESLGAMAGRHLLLRLNATGGPLWDKAVDLDAALQLDAVWGAKPEAERFAEVERRLAKELGVTLAAPPTPNPPAPAPAPRQPAADPGPALEIQPFRPTTSSDLVSGAPPDAGNGFSEAADGMAMANRFRQMDDSQIAAQIRRATGG